MFDRLRGKSKGALIAIVSAMMVLGMTGCDGKKSENKTEAAVVTADAESQKDSGAEKDGKKDSTKDDKKASDDAKDSKKDSQKTTDNSKGDKKDSKKDSSKNDKKNDKKADKDSGSSGSGGSGNYGGYSGGSGNSGNGDAYTVKSEEPKAEQPKPQEPKTEEPKAEEPKTEQPKPQEPNTEQPKPQEPNTEQPKSQEPNTEQPKPEDPKPEDPKPEDPKPEDEVEYKKVELSGDASEWITFDTYAYCEGDNFNMYFEKGATVPGDAAIRVDEIMDELENMYSLSYDVDKKFDDSDWREFHMNNHFMDVNLDCSKINVMVKDYKDNGEIEWASYNDIMLFDEDFGPDVYAINTLSHELTHVLRLRQSGFMGNIFEEGVAVYSQYHVSMNHGYPEWNMYSYMRDSGCTDTYDETELLQNPEKVYRETDFADRCMEQPEYQVGLRFVTFLIEENGMGIIKTISETASKYTIGYQDEETIIKVLKEAAGDDVFERFIAWLPEGWDRFGTEYMEYIAPFEEGLY